MGGEGNDFDGASRQLRLSDPRLSRKRCIEYLVMYIYYIFRCER